MYSTLEQAPPDTSPEPIIELSGIPGVTEVALAERSMSLDNSQGSVNVKVVAVTHDLLGIDPHSDHVAAIGKRTHLGVAVESQDGSKRTFVQSVAGPLWFRTKKPNEPQLDRERTALRRTGARAADIGRRALRHSGLIAPSPNAEPAEGELYETTAPGVGLLNAIWAVQTAYTAGRLSENEAANIFTSMYDAATSSLTAFHNTKLIHGHAHLRNFIIDPATGNVQLIDYTLAVKKNLILNWARRNTVGADEWNAAQDRARFKREWKEQIEKIGLSPTTSHLSMEERKVAAAQLERAVALDALHKVTGVYPSEGEIDRFIDIQHDLISDAPTVTYPQAA